MKKKYFFFDIDGTLTDLETGRIVPSAKRTLEALQEAGHFVAIATGRIHYKAKSFTDKINIHNLVCSGGGCLVIEDKIIENKPLPLEKAMSLLQHAEKENIGYLLLLEDTDAVYMKDYLFLEQAGFRQELTTYHYDPDLDYSSLKEIYKVYLAIHQDEVDKYPWCNDLTKLRLHPNYFVYQHDEKKAGIRKMLHYLDAKEEDIVVFGDDLNDLAMFDPYFFCIAMANAKEEVKEIADYITDNNVDDGIEKACKHFGWIK
ncbi:MAG: HAD family phosphatase [Solobacterium sp.]|nr:HAD family phosphatase [Solobacterium sp.]